MIELNDLRAVIEDYKVIYGDDEAFKPILAILDAKYDDDKKRQLLSEHQLILDMLSERMEKKRLLGLVNEYAEEFTARKEFPRASEDVLQFIYDKENDKVIRIRELSIYRLSNVLSEVGARLDPKVKLMPEDRAFIEELTPVRELLGIKRAAEYFLIKGNFQQKQDSSSILKQLKSTDSSRIKLKLIKELREYSIIASFIKAYENKKKLLNDCKLHFPEINNEILGDEGESYLDDLSAIEEEGYDVELIKRICERYKPPQPIESNDPYYVIKTNYEEPFRALKIKLMEECLPEKKVQAIDFYRQSDNKFNSKVQHLLSPKALLEVRLARFFLKQLKDIHQCPLAEQRIKYQKLLRCFPENFIKKIIRTNQEAQCYFNLVKLACKCIEFNQHSIEMISKGDLDIERYLNAEKHGKELHKTLSRVIANWSNQRLDQQEAQKEWHDAITSHQEALKPFRGTFRLIEWFLSFVFPIKSKAGDIVSHLSKVSMFSIKQKNQEAHAPEPKPGSPGLGKNGLVK